MNTIRSVGYGWGVLIVAGAGSYYFAKRSINADREERALQEERRRQQNERLRAQEAVTREMALTSLNPAKANSATPSTSADHPSPSREGAIDPAPITHIPESRYEAKEAFRSRKGDRFS